MYLTVHLAPRVAALLRKAEEDPQVASLKQLTASLGLQLRPLHPELESTEMADQFYASVDDPSQAEHACSELLKHPAVTAAYTKPVDEPPQATP